MGLQKTQESHKVDKFINALTGKSGSLEDRIAYLESQEGRVSNKIAIIQDQKVAGTDGGTATSGSWFTRTLNTVVIDTSSIVGLASNQITLQAGTYLIQASAPAFNARRYKIRLRNITDGTTVGVGTSEASFPASDVQTRSFVTSMFTITSAKVFEIQQRVETTTATNGQGIGSGAFGEVEVYADVLITKIS